MIIHIGTDSSAFAHVESFILWLSVESKKINIRVHLLHFGLLASHSDPHFPPCHRSHSTL
ncbi:MAG: hypothetical protein DSZ28_03325 [Thiothrix sp.]|nr:MAG: hypothetical protein DSZ28_03325 [Thiothrix sp.]